MARLLTYALALIAMAAAPGLAQGVGRTSSLTPKLSKTIRDTDTGVRAEVSYYNDVLTGGQEVITADDGTTSILHWDGSLGVFEIAILAEPTDGSAIAKSFFAEVILAVCPSADKTYVPVASVQLVAAGVYQVEAQCPAIDRKTGH